MNNDSQDATDTIPDAEPVVAETSTAITEIPAQATKTKKTVRAFKSVKAVKAAKPARARKSDKVEKAVAPAEEETAKTVAKTAKTGEAAKATKSAKSAKPASTVEAKKVPAAIKTSKAAKPEKTIEAERAVQPKAGKSARKTAKATPATAPAKRATSAAKGNGKGARYSTNELSSAARKAGLTFEFTPVVTKPANIGRGPAKEFKVDAIVAHLRGSNGDLIRDRGPGTPFYNDAESLAAVEIFEKFRSRTFHKKLKVDIL